MAARTWRVVGGADAEGIVVRAAKALSSAAFDDRLSTGALVREVERAGNRLRYERLTGAGPRSGWVSIAVKERELLVPEPEAAASEPAEALAWAPGAGEAPAERRGPTATPPPDGASVGPSALGVGAPSAHAHEEAADIGTAAAAGASAAEAPVDDAVGATTIPAGASSADDVGGAVAIAAGAADVEGCEGGAAAASSSAAEGGAREAPGGAAAVAPPSSLGVGPLAGEDGLGAVLAEAGTASRAAPLPEAGAPASTPASAATPVAEGDDATAPAPAPASEPSPEAAGSSTPQAEPACADAPPPAPAAASPAPEPASVPPRPSVRPAAEAAEAAQSGSAPQPPVAVADARALPQPPQRAVAERLPPPPSASAKKQLPAADAARAWLGRLAERICAPRRCTGPMLSADVRGVVGGRAVQEALAETLRDAAEALIKDGEVQEAGLLAVRLQDAAFTFLRLFEDGVLRAGAPSTAKAQEEPQAERAQMSCCSPGCEYRVHSNDKYGSYCCIACFETLGADHGTRCERLKVEGDGGAEKPPEPPVDNVAQDECDAAQARQVEAMEKPAKEPPPLSKEEAEANAVMEEAKRVSEKLREAASALLGEGAKEKREAATTASKDLLGNSVPDERSADKLALVKTLQDAAQVLLKDSVLDRAGKLAKKLQDTAFTLLTEDIEGQPNGAKTSEAKHADSELKDDAPKTVEEWRADIAKLVRSRDEGALAQAYQDAAAALLKDGKAEDSRTFAKDAETLYRRMGSRWRLGVVLDTLASAHIKLHASLATAEGAEVAELRKHAKLALEPADEAVTLLRRIGHPKEEADLARARSTLAAARALETGASGAEAARRGAPAAPRARLTEAERRAAELKLWRDTVAQQRAWFRQAPEGRGDAEGFGAALQAAALVFLRRGVPEEARLAAEEAVGLYRQMRAARRLGVALDTVARAHLACRLARDQDGEATALWERQHHLKAKTAATEAATLLNQSASPDWLSACAAARSTLLRVRAIELREGRQSLFPTISHIFRRSGGTTVADEVPELQRSFGYAGGLEKPMAFAKFDVRDDVCLRVGGFAHGRVVRDRDGQEFVVVGVKPSDDDEKALQLWFQPRSIPTPAALSFAALTPAALAALLTAVGTEDVRQVRPEEFDAAEDSDGELLTLCHECMLPIGASKYVNHDGEGVCHGECMAKILLDASKAEDRAREREEEKRKLRDREEYNIGWKPERMIPRNLETMRKRRIPHPRGVKPDTMFCLALEGDDPPKLRVIPTTDPEAFVNLSYLLTALQVRIRAGMAPYFSLDTPNAEEPWQVKTFGPPWLKGTRIGEVLFQADYHLKELSMGDSLFEQPAIGMRNCWDFEWKTEGWRGREWFVVKHAKVLLSSNGVLLPHVEMGVEAREQVANAQKQLVDAPVTSKGHPLVKYAEMFSHNFDLIAERKSVVYQLREVSKAAIVAKFLVDNKVELGDCWLRPDDDTALCKMDLPFNKKERIHYEILVRDGAIHEHHGGVLSSMVGLYGGVDLNIDAFDLSMPLHRLSRSVKTPDYSAIYAEPGQMASASELSRLSTREVRRLIQEAGGEAPRGPVDKAELIELLLEVRPQHAEAEPDAGAGGAEDAGAEEGLAYAGALAEDLRRLSFSEDSVRTIVDAVRARALGEAQDKAPEESGAQKGFWESLDEDTPKGSVFRAVFNSRLADRRAERALFVPPSEKEAYVRKLAALVEDEREVQRRRREHFCSTDFVPMELGPLFPSVWRPRFCMHFARGSSVAAGGDAARGRQLSPSEADPAAVLRRRPVFDGSTEDGVRYRIYRQGAVEVRTLQLPGEGSEEEVGAVFEARPAPPPADHHLVVKATEFVRSGEAGAPLYRYFVVYETDLGDELLTEQRGDGPSWEANPVDMEERYESARVLRVSDSSSSGVTVGALRAAAGEPGSAALSSRRYAQRAFERPGGAPVACSGQLRLPEQGAEGLAAFAAFPGAQPAQPQRPPAPPPSAGPRGWLWPQSLQGTGHAGR